MFNGRKLPLFLTVIAVLGLAFAVSCRGFFVNPTLSSLAVSPKTPTIQTGTSGNTQQFTAVGTFNDGSTGHPKVTWNSSDTTIATISDSGLATSVSLGSSTITATSTDNATISGSTTLTVTVGCIQKIDLTPTGPSIKVGATQQFQAMATTCKGSFDITTVATWVSSNTSVATINSSGLATALAQGVTNITASSGNVTSAVDQLTVNP